MAKQKTDSRLLAPRALLVITALISLCVSSDVGPRFAPLPSLTDSPSTVGTIQYESASSARVGANSFRVPMMAQTQRRVDQQHHSQPFAESPKGLIALLTDRVSSVEDNIEVSVVASAPLSQPPGRSPPSSL